MSLSSKVLSTHFNGLNSMYQSSSSILKSVSDIFLSENDFTLVSISNNGDVQYNQSNTNETHNIINLSSSITDNNLVKIINSCSIVGDVVTNLTGKSLYIRYTYGTEIKEKQVTIKSIEFTTPNTNIVFNEEIIFGEYSSYFYNNYIIERYPCGTNYNINQGSIYKFTLPGCGLFENINQSNINGDVDTIFGVNDEFNGNSDVIKITLNDTGSIGLIYNLVKANSNIYTGVNLYDESYTGEYLKNIKLRLSYDVTIDTVNYNENTYVDVFAIQKKVIEGSGNKTINYYLRKTNKTNNNFDFDRFVATSQGNRLAEVYISFNEFENYKDEFVLEVIKSNVVKKYNINNITKNYKNSYFVTDLITQQTETYTNINSIDVEVISDDLNNFYDDTCSISLVRKDVNYTYVSNGNERVVVTKSFIDYSSPVTDINYTFGALDTTFSSDTLICFVSETINNSHKLFYKPSNINVLTNGYNNLFYKTFSNSTDYYSLPTHSFFAKVANIKSDILSYEYNDGDYDVIINSNITTPIKIRSTTNGYYPFYLFTKKQYNIINPVNNGNYIITLKAYNITNKTVNKIELQVNTRLVESNFETKYVDETIIGGFAVVDNKIDIDTIWDINNKPNIKLDKYLIDLIDGVTWRRFSNLNKWYYISDYTITTKFIPATEQELEYMFSNRNTLGRLGYVDLSNCIYNVRYKTIIKQKTVANTVKNNQYSFEDVQSINQYKRVYICENQ